MHASVLQHHADAAARGQEPRGTAEQLRATGIGRQQAQQQADRRALACAIGAKQRDHLARPQLKIHAVQGDDVAIAFAGGLQAGEQGRVGAADGHVHGAIIRAGHARRQSHRSAAADDRCHVTPSRAGFRLAGPGAARERQPGLLPAAGVLPSSGHPHQRQSDEYQSRAAPGTPYRPPPLPRQRGDGSGWSWP